jgi:hypothetical protein
MLQDLAAFCEPSRNHIGGDRGQDTEESRTGNQANIAALGSKPRGAEGHEGQRAERGAPPIEERRNNREPEIVEGGVGDENGAEEKPEHPAIGANESDEPGRLASNARNSPLCLPRVSWARRSSSNSFTRKTDTMLYQYESLYTALRKHRFLVTFGNLRHQR